MKSYIYSQEELAKIPIDSRDKYYFDDRLVAKSLGFVKNDEKMVEIKSEEVPFLVEPFWQDKPFEVEDLELQKLLDSEGEAFRRYIQSHPDFSMQIRETVLDKLVEAQQNLPG
jgi:hypothetical protein